MGAVLCCGAQDALATVLTLVAEPLGAHPRMSTEQGKTVSLVLVLLRNLLLIQDQAAAPRGRAAGQHRTQLHVGVGVGGPMANHAI